MLNNISKKTLIIVIISSVLLLAMIAFSIYFFGFRNQADEYQKRIEDKMEKLTINFYENNYYDNMDINIIKGFEKSGIKVTLNSLQMVNNDETIIKNDKTDEKCNLSETYVEIYPEKPFGKTDYRIEYTLACGDFD